MDNAALLALLTGTWKDDEGRWALVVKGDGTFSLTLEEKPVLAGELDFTYLLPHDGGETELTRSDPTLQRGDGRVLGEVAALCYAPEGESGVLHMDIGRTEGDGETVILQKTEKGQFVRRAADGTIDVE